jgi:hypothetical protein
MVRHREWSSGVGGCVWELNGFVSSQEMLGSSEDGRGKRALEKGKNQGLETKFLSGVKVMST